MNQAPNAEGVRNSRALIVRNTADQLTKTTRKTFFTWFPPGLWGTWKESEKEYVIRKPLQDGTVLNMVIWFMPLDKPSDVQRALSLEITFLYGNEWRELHADVVNGLLDRLTRYPSGPDGAPTRSCAIFDSNMPDADTWHAETLHSPPSNWDVFVQPPAILDEAEWAQKYDAPPTDDPIEGYPDADGTPTKWWVDFNADNMRNLHPTYYHNLVPGKSKDHVDVYYRCKIGRSLAGLPVYDRSFNEHVHVAKETFRPIKSSQHPVVIGLDFGRTPAAVFLQRNPFGQVICLAEITSENMGLENFIDQELRPMMAEPRFLGCTFVVAPDPSGDFKQQINEVTPFGVLQAAGFAIAPPGSNKLAPRIGAVERLLTRTIGGRQGFQINPECTTIVSGCKFGYRFALNKAGNPTNEPDKTGPGKKYTHAHDALQYAAMVIDGNQIASGLYQPVTKAREIHRSGYYIG